MTDLPDARNVPSPLRDRYLSWRSNRSSTHSRFGHIDGIKGAHPAATAVKEYSRSCLDGYLKGATAYWRAQGDVTRPDAGRLVLGAKTLRKAVKRPRELLQAAHTHAIEALADVNDRLERRLQTTDPAQAVLDGEMRAALRGLDHSARRKLVRDDVRYAAAVARAPAALSGANEGLAGDARDAYLRSVAPDDLAAFEDLSAAEQCARETVAALDRLPMIELGCDFKKADELAKASEAAEVA